MNALRSTTLAAALVAALALYFSLVGPLVETGFGYSIAYISSIVGPAALILAGILGAAVLVVTKK